jgi:hypothetical protein
MNACHDARFAPHIGTDVNTVFAPLAVMRADARCGTDRNQLYHCKTVSRRRLSSGKEPTSGALWNTTSSRVASECLESLNDKYKTRFFLRSGLIKGLFI